MRWRRWSHASLSMAGGRGFDLLVSLLLTAAAAGCDRGRSGPPKVQLVKVGMTVQQVEQVLGKPVRVRNIPTLPGVQLREYRGDGEKRLFITFETGVVTDIDESAPRHNWPPVGVA